MHKYYETGAQPSNKLDPASSSLPFISGMRVEECVVSASWHSFFFFVCVAVFCFEKKGCLLQKHVPGNISAYCYVKLEHCLRSLSYALQLFCWPSERIIRFLKERICNPSRISITDAVGIFDFAEQALFCNASVVARAVP